MFISETNLITLTFIIAIACFIATRLNTKVRNEKLEQVLTSVASKYGGTVEQNRYTYGPILKLNFSDNLIEIYAKKITNSRSGKPHFSTHMYCSRRSVLKYKIKIYKEVRMFGVGTVFGQDLKTNNSEFNNAYVIQGSNEMIVRNFLTDNIIKNFLRMKNFNLTLKVNRKKFQIDISGLLETEEEYIALIENGLPLISRISEIG